DGHVTGVQTCALPILIVDQAAAEMRGMADRANVALLVGESSGGVMADADRLVQVLTNLVSNAIKFSPEEGTVRLTSSSDGQRVRSEERRVGKGAKTGW